MVLWTGNLFSWKNGIKTVYDLHRYIWHHFRHLGLRHKNLNLLMGEGQMNKQLGTKYKLHWDNWVVLFWNGFLFDNYPQPSPRAGSLQSLFDKAELFSGLTGCPSLHTSGELTFWPSLVSLIYITPFHSPFTEKNGFFSPGALRNRIRVWWKATFLSASHTGDLACSQPETSHE
jgi:hypothetical protein